jgi:hypothetical protein
MKMYLMYLDDSGSQDNERDTHLVLGGLIIHKDEFYHLQKAMDDLADALLGSEGRDEEFHASAIYNAHKPPWDRFEQQEQREIIKKVLRVGVKQCRRGLPPEQERPAAALFACAVNKADFPGQDAMEMAFDDLCGRFEKFLHRQHRIFKHRFKGMIILDKSSRRAQEATLQKLARNFTLNGTRWGVQTENILDVPMFVDSRASRGIQLADAVAHAVFRYYARGDSKYFDVIKNNFDMSDNTLHGLCHKTRSSPSCSCPFCRQFNSRARG